MFCKICGNELNEQAVICPKCGCAVETVKLPKRKQTFNSATFMAVCKYVSIVLLCFAFMFMMLSIICSYVNVNDYLNLEYKYNKYNLLGSIYVSWWTNWGLALPCLIFSILSYVFSATGFAFGFKRENKEKRFSSDVIFIISHFVLVLSIVCITFSW